MKARATLVLAVFLVLLSVRPGLGQSESGVSLEVLEEEMQAAVCGNGSCETGESCTSCPQDCGGCPDSCFGRCNEVAPAGCSCAVNCGYFGTCCPDIVSACPSDPAFPDNPFSHGAGTEFFQITPSVNTNVSQATVHIGGSTPTRPIAHSTRSFAGFSMISLGGMTEQSEKVWCQLGQSTGMWTVTAGFISGQDSWYSSCTANVFNWPASAPPLTVSGEYRAESHNDSLGQVVPMGGSGTSIAVLSYVNFERTVSSVDTICSVYQSGPGYNLFADSDNQSDAWCGARLLSWNVGSGIQKVPGNAADSFYVGSCRWDTGGRNTDCPDNEEGLESNDYAREVDMGPRVSATHTRACFLSRYETGYPLNMGLSADVACQIVEKEDRLFLRAKPNKGRTWAKCNARCLDYPNSMAWPPAPSVKGVGAVPADPGGVPLAGDASVPQIGAGLAGSGGSKTGVCALGGECPGGRLNLYRSPDGVYDRPVLYVGGFDPTNEGGVWSSVRDLGAGIRGLGAAGVDAWFLKPSGTADIRVAAREVARAIVNVYTHDPDGTGSLLPFNLAFPGRKIVVVGNSQGALDTRIALSTWEQGNLYQPTGASEYVPGAAAVGVIPVSLWVANNGPQLGATASTTAQVIINEAYRRLPDEGISIPPGPVAAINSIPAQEMLTKRTRIDCASKEVDAADGLFTEWCPHGVGRDLGARYVPKDGDVYANGDDWVAAGGCSYETEPRQSFSLDVDHRGGGNGFPQSMKSVGFSDGSFSPQSCENMLDPNACIVIGTPDPFVADQEFAKIELAESGGPFGICARNSRVLAELTPTDLQGGDLRDSFVATFDVGALPSEVSRIFLSDNFPLVFIPTESALACSGTAGSSGCNSVPGTTRKDHVSCDGVCRAANLSASRFNNVFSSPEDKNGPHRSLPPLLQQYALAYIHEYAVRDGDGLMGGKGTNPYHPAGGIPGESSDCDDSIPSGAPCDGPDGDLCKEGTYYCNGASLRCSDTTGTTPEVCNGIDDDCDGSIDEALSGNTEFCDGDDDNCDGLVDGTCGLTTASCPNQSIIWEFTANNSRAVCLSEGICTDAFCDERCEVKPVNSGCNGNTSSCPGGTTARYTTGHLLFACLHDAPSTCRCLCEAVGATYKSETTAPCTSCGNGVCDGSDTCESCPGDCYQTVTLPNNRCLFCDSTGESHCGPGTFTWCCPPL